MKNKHPFSTGKFIIKIISILSIAAICSGCALVLKPQESATETPEPDPETLPPLVDISFFVTLNPESMPVAGERMVIEILDEVTGLPYHIQQYDMARSGDFTFSITLPFPSGSVIKYRYAKVGTEIVPEATMDGMPVRYRMFYAVGKESVSDLLLTWENIPTDFETGKLTGKIIDPITSKPIPDILVSASGYLTFTDANGVFSLENMMPGIHNVLFYAMDGKYKTFQQGATISAGLSTPAEIVMIPMALVTVTLLVNVPNDAIGVPIYVAGNIQQFGNTFSDLPGGMSLKQKQMPMLSPVQDNTYMLSMRLYAETDLRFKFTLGDGYWNAEQQSTGLPVQRQLVIPNHDVNLTLNVESWRTKGFEPVSIQVNIPPESSPPGEKYIQFQTAEWTEPIPLWPIGDGNYLIILFSPFEATLPISYRFCRNEACEATHTTMDAVQPGTAAKNVDVVVTNWQNWQVFSQPAEVIASFVTNKGDLFTSMIELSPAMNPSWTVYASNGFGQASEMGTEALIFSPTWFTFEKGHLNPVLGQTPYHANLVDLINGARFLDLNTAIFPQIQSTEVVQPVWEQSNHTEAWWMTWFGNYRRMILNYAQIASETNSEWLILGGKDVVPALLNGTYPDGTPSDVPENSQIIWEQIITDIRAVYTGKLVWAATMNQSLDPLPGFMDKLDEIYISIDTPLSMTPQPTSEEITTAFTELVDTTLYETYQFYGKPVYLAFGYPSAVGSAQGCFLVSESCRNDARFESHEMTNMEADFNAQLDIYNTIFPILTSRDWISGVSIKGFEPTKVVIDNTSTLWGKPAMDVIWYWYSGLE
jgi:hypothetical protein